MRYCRCFSCKYLLRYELKTECGQFLHFLTGLFIEDSWFGIVKLNFPIFFMIYSTAQLGDISVMFRRCLLSDSILRLFSRILFFEFLFQPSLSQNIFSTFLTHISVLVRRFIRLLVTCPQSCNYAYSWGIISTENSLCKLIKCHYIRDWKLEILNGWHFMFHVN